MDGPFFLWISTLEALSDLITGPAYIWTLMAIVGRLVYVGSIWMKLSR